MLMLGVSITNLRIDAKDKHRTARLDTVRGLVISGSFVNNVIACDPSQKFLVLPG